MRAGSRSGAACWLSSYLSASMARSGLADRMSRSKPERGAAGCAFSKGWNISAAGSTKALIKRLRQKAAALRIWLLLTAAATLRGQLDLRKRRCSGDAGGLSGRTNELPDDGPPHR